MRGFENITYLDRICDGCSIVQSLNLQCDVEVEGLCGLHFQCGRKLAGTLGRAESASITASALFSTSVLFCLPAVSPAEMISFLIL